MSSTSTPTAGSDRAVTEPFEDAHHRPRMQGHVVFVTGGSRGIGAAICRSFAEQGAVVAAGYGGNEERAKQLCDELKGHGVDTSIHQGNAGRAARSPLRPCGGSPPPSRHSPDGCWCPRRGP